MAETVPLKKATQAPHSTPDQLPYVDTPLREPEDDGGDLLHYFWGVWEYKWAVAAIMFLSLAYGFAKFVSTPPTFVAGALMQLEKREAGLSALQAFEEYGQLLGGSVSVAAEIEIMQSRTIMSEVAEKLQLDIRASPIQYPFIGEPLARYFDGPGVAKPWFNKEEYAWGGEEIEVRSFLLPDTLLGTAFTLVALDAGQYVLYDDEDRLVLKGKTGVRAETQLDSGEQLTLFVSRLKARPGTRFSLSRAPLAHVAAELSENFTAVENPTYSGILRLGFTGGIPTQIANILNTILDTYQRQNVERKGAEAGQTLLFLETQLPPLKERLEAAEVAYNGYLQEHGSIDITRESQNVLTAMVEIESEIFDVQQERETLRERFKPTHPKIKSHDVLIGKLREKLAELEKQTETLPEVQQAVLKLARDVEVNSSLYSRLINTLQELRIAKAGTVGNARIIDYALPPHLRTSPILTRIIAIHGLVGLFLGVGIVILKLRMRQGVDDPSDIERELGVSVFGTVPYSEAQDNISKQLKKKKSVVAPLAVIAPDDLAIESIRSLRTSLHFLLLDSDNNVLLVSGPTEGVGKSFLSVNLAVVLAQTGKRVLLIDGDMRKGHLNKHLGVDSVVGLSEYIAGTATLGDAVSNLDLTELDFMGTGARPPNPSELLMHERFARLLEWGQKTYDFVIIDAPPILAVTDAAIIARHAGATLLAAMYGRHPMGELEETLKRMRHGGAQVRGFVMNGIDTHRRYGYRYGYRYSYQDAD